MRRDKIKHMVGKIAVRIHYRNAFSVFNIRKNHVFKKRGFAHTGFTNDVDVAATIERLDTKFLRAAAEITFAE